MLKETTGSSRDANRSAGTLKTSTSRNSQKTFLVRAIQLFQEKVKEKIALARVGRDASILSVQESLRKARAALNIRNERPVVLLTPVVWVGIIWIVLPNIPEYRNESLWGFYFVYFFVSLGVARAIAWATLSVVCVTPLIMSLLASIIFFLPIILWTPVYVSMQALVVVGKFLLLVPLIGLFVCTRGLQLWRGIFHTCPARDCSYRGLPAYGCADCGVLNYQLWPNLYGLLWHYCIGCDQRLPTLDLLGRKSLSRHCGDPQCRMPLLGKHAGRVPERLVAIAGAPSSGKTNYLLMAVHELLNSNGNGLRGEIDDNTQAEEFRHERRNLEAGFPSAKTSAVAKAMLLYVKARRTKCQLYLYDAPGEEFLSIGSLSERQYLSLLEGFILLVDPLSFASVRGQKGRKDGQGSSLKDVAAAISAASAGVRTGRDGKRSVRVAVVISKADLEPVRNRIGDIRRERIARAVCRQAIVDWGGRNEIQALENQFAAVEYFACSPLGRAVDASNRQPFRGYGVLEPLRWILLGGSSQAQD
ncbi:MAG: hypothetical protein HYZ50_20235 [Deltaproteobacteria bacterium]|nr:hypothetical protein [Deltaproteobacteria bacterium]